ncbi:hypothetical protein LUZ62_038363 [Rhynchospora pubera]|uniref:Transcription factor CBF/NF-Y/archaeal histone domain-containing protein n=1 Tax=Rhynchospora pubera TaxID=906938 RepID=A0AAV8F133_9POAL|nr:hypothetical protein LUZ62_056127 [Rhynchospora pubera]KAJ4787117.1 hypothetical protein LUZ62_038363 [Rhynchospora pubera]
MRKKLDTRFPAARIKKIMQADEDVGKIAMAVPVLVSKALEMFLQDLCDRTYSITLQRGMKTMSSQHLKQCVHGFSHYDFLREIVSKVPDMGNTDGGSGEGRSTQRRRTAEEDDNEEQSKRARIDVIPVYNTTSSSIGVPSGTGRGRGRPRGSGRGRRGGARGAERDASHYYEDDPGASPVHTDEVGPTAVLPDTVTESVAPRNFDLNMDFSEKTPAPVGSSVPTEPQPSEMIQDLKHEEYPGWSVEEMKKIAVDPVQFALTHQKVDEEEEDYDNDDG